MSGEQLSFILLVVLGAALLVQLLYYLVIFSRLAFHKIKITPHEPQPVSVIICARNEIKNLQKNIYAVLEQAYRDFQVIVVNDCSWDDTEEFLKELSAKYPHLKVVTLKEQERYQHGKKFALAIGIKAAKHDLLLMTDADCLPAGKNWLTNMQNRFEKGVDIVLGYGAFFRKPGFLNKLIRYDGAYTAMQYLSFALAGRPYMGVGRNLAYRKELFFKNKGFASHYHLLSGDDDLFVNETASRTNTVVEIQPESFTYSEPRSTWMGWFRQKKRHLSTGPHYRAGDKFLLGTLFVSHFIFYSVLITLIALQHDWQMLLALYGGRLLVQLIIFGLVLKRLDELDVIWLLPVFDFFILIIYSTLALGNLFFKTKRWS